MESRIIEFIGHPGSGKSTITASFCKKLSKNKKVLNLSYEIGKKDRIQRVFIKSFFVVIALQKNFNLSLKIFLYLNKVRSLKERLKIFYNFLFLNGLIIKNYNKYDYLLFDQGLIQGIWSYLISLKEIREEEIIKIFELFNLGNKNYNLILVDVDIEEIKIRLNERDGCQSRFEKIDNETELDKKLEKSNEILKKLSDKVKKKIIVRNNNFKELEISLKILERKFMS